MNIDAHLLQQAAAAAAGGQQYPSAALYLVATPIGNLADLSLRAITVLGLVDALACEDSRVSGALLHHLGLDKPLVALHEHNEREAAAAVIERLTQGQRVAYASDAGTPAISDPGARLVALARQAGHRVIPIPGPSSAIAAFSVAGDVQAAGFRFCGFVPAKGRERDAAIAQACADTQAQVWFETPHRIVALAQAWAAAAPQRTATLCRELTKQFETVATMAASELPQWLVADANRQRGEFVLVLHAQAPSAQAAGISAGALATLDLLLAELPLKQAVALAARISGESRNELYDAALARRKGAPD
ncbi:MAG: 16S rRNA (cytidine(1402)-2'-O)-methyltransferase [Burkholderiaceae bacterium]